MRYTFGHIVKLIPGQGRGKPEDTVAHRAGPGKLLTARTRRRAEGGVGGRPLQAVIDSLLRITEIGSDMCLLQKKGRRGKGGKQAWRGFFDNLDN